MIVYPGDVVKVARAGVVYVEGEVKKPGGFMLKTNENISVLQAVALAARGATLLFCVAEFISEIAMTPRPAES